MCLSELSMLLGIGIGGVLVILLRRRMDRNLSETLFLVAGLLPVMAFRAMRVRLGGFDSGPAFGFMGGYLMGGVRLFQCCAVGRCKIMDAIVCLLKLELVALAWMAGVRLLLAFLMR